MSIAMSVVEDQPRLSVQANQPRPGRLRAQNVAETDRYIALAMHLSPFGFFIVGPLAFLVPLILWLIRKDQSAFSDDHGRECINFMISAVLWIPILVISIIGIPFLLAWPFVVVINLIRAAVAAGGGEYFRYPITFRFL